MILVTGASGFIGKHLLRSLVNIYGRENVVALTSLPLADYTCLLHKGYEFDIDFFRASGYGSIHTVIHAGAFIPKSAKDANYLKGCNSNIWTTKKILDCELPQLQKFIFISTVDIYGISDIITEETNINPVSLYGLSKYYCERMIETWGKEKSVITQILRIGHVYGPGEESFQKIIPITFKKLVNNQAPQLLGSGEEKRSFIFINDVIKSIINSLGLKELVGPVNLVSTQVISIRQLLDLLIKISGKNVVIETISETLKGRDLVFDNNKMKDFLLDSETPLREGLTEEWNYMKQLQV